MKLKVEEKWMEKKKPQTLKHKKGSILDLLVCGAFINSLEDGAECTY